jgi:hypothetical protein
MLFFIGHRLTLDELLSTEYEQNAHRQTDRQTAFQKPLFRDLGGLKIYKSIKISTTIHDQNIFFYYIYKKVGAGVAQSV